MSPMVNPGKIKNIGRLITGSILTIAPVMSVAAPNECADWIAKVVSTEGRVETRAASDTSPDIIQGVVWQPVTLNQTLCPGSVVHTQAHSRAALLLRNNTVLRLSQKSTLTLPAAQPDKPFWLELLDGAINVITRTPKKFQIDTPSVNAAVDGTEFFVKVARAPLPEGGGVNSGQTTVSVFEGRVIVENPTGSVVLRSGEVATASAGQTPIASIPINPIEQREAVHWALHYPPILSYRADDFKEGDETSWQARVRKSIEYTQAGDLQNALASVIDTPQDAAAAFFGYRASHLLNVGRVNEASVDIKTALDIAPNNGIALALQSVIAVAQNHYETALTLATQSTAHAPHVAGSWMALSYAQQANFNLPEAINAAQHGADSEPDNALAWARIAELHLMTGNLDAALAAASKATALNPNLARTQSVLGFVYLTQIKTKHARQAFEQAITLDQADPLPRLGLGLAKIRDGDLTAGREDIEIATALDPNNALVRSYMGKAYYEEKRAPLAATQFYIAKTLDPKDPTPWFYDAILKQSTNRPVEALQDLQKSIELNDNRAVYRSRLLLDQDQAARSASIAKIYQTLGFESLARVEGTRSLDLDVGNFSAHRLLADTYVGLPRHEIARVSELLQAQLLQPLNVTPVSLGAAQTNLLSFEGTGPSATSFNEFNPLFYRKRLAFQANGIYGSDGTRGGEAVAAALMERGTLSVGRYTYRTDGVRKNNDKEQTINNVFAQYLITPDLSAQVEYRDRSAELGDTQLRFDDTFSDIKRRTIRQENWRLGLRYGPEPTHTFLLAVNAEHLLEKIAFETLDYSLTNTDDINGIQYEAQYLWQGAKSSVVAGLGYLNADWVFSENISAPLFFVSSEDRIPQDIEQANGYVYAHLPLAHSVLLLGASYDSLTQENSITRDQLNPKLGLTWDATARLTLRTAAFRTLRRQLTQSQTLEPTQVAGFNQFFDDQFGTDAWRYGVGLDYHRPDTPLKGGMELTKRTLTRVFSGSGTLVEEDGNEWLHRVYLYWNFGQHLALNTEYYYEKSRRDFIPGKQSPRPASLITQSTPFTVHFFHPDGFFTRLRATYVNQHITNVLSPTGMESFHDNFVILDAALGYRLPKRRGIVELSGRNLGDTRFHYQSIDSGTNIDLPSPYYPYTAFFINAQLWF